jgi:hypothetical protein
VRFDSLEDDIEKTESFWFEDFEDFLPVEADLLSLDLRDAAFDQDVFENARLPAPFELDLVDTDRFEDCAGDPFFSSAACEKPKASSMSKLASLESPRNASLSEKKSNISVAFAIGAVEAGAKGSCASLNIAKGSSSVVGLSFVFKVSSC